MDISVLELEALGRDAQDPLRSFRNEFWIPRHGTDEQIYFCGNSLGLQPKSTRQALIDELDDWSHLAVEAHFRGRHPWMSIHETVRDNLASVVGAKPLEVVAMNSLTANLHLMMVSFYRPSAKRNAILVEAGSFPSDRYAVESQIKFHGFDPDTSLIELQPDLPGGVFSDALIENTLREHGHRIALVLWPGVQYRTGQAFDLGRISQWAHAQGCMVGFDLAHAVGNVVLNLHDSQADFAVWCHYKYMNAGPGAVGGCFVHERHARSQLPRFAGWWGHDQNTRFKMGPDFQPTAGADGWQLSNPPVLAITPLRTSLELFARAGMGPLRQKSEQLTAWLETLVKEHLSDVLEILTPSEASARGCQLSIRVRGGREQGRDLFDFLASQGVLGDWREPDVIRISPTPLYNRYIDILRFVLCARQWADK